MPTTKKATKNTPKKNAHRAKPQSNPSSESNPQEVTMPAKIDATSPSPPSTVAVSVETATTTATFLPPPPPVDPKMVPPGNFVPDNSMDFRGVLPRTSELIVLPTAIGDLAKFTDYPEVMGSKAPSLAQAREAFTVTDAWSTMRTMADAWDKYARTQEGVAWSQLRPLLARMGPAYALAVQADPSMAATYAGLTTLLGAKKAIAQKAVATKKANKKNLAEGKAPTHGKVGKKAIKDAQKAALAAKEAAANGAAIASAPTAVPAPVAPAAPTNGTGNATH